MSAGPPEWALVVSVSFNGGRRVRIWVPVWVLVYVFGVVVGGYAF